MSLQGLPLFTSSSLENLLLVISNLAMKGSILVGELTHFPDWTASADMVDLSPYYKTTSIYLYICSSNNSVVILHYAGLRER
jgi:hypothetical protein